MIPSVSTGSPLLALLVEDDLRLAALTREYLEGHGVAVVRRAKGQAGPSQEAVRVGGLVVDPAARRVTLDGREVALTGYEFALLLALARRAGRVLAREQLMELAGGSAEEAFDRSIDVHVSRLRQKLGDDPKRPRLIKTVRGAGYVLAGEAE